MLVSYENRFGTYHLVVQDFVLNFSLMSLCDIYYNYAYKGLILTFVER